MHILIVTLLIGSLPGVVAADSWFDYMTEHAENGGGTVVIENTSSVSTGGQVAGSGQAVVTDGDVSASSHVETRINAGSEGGSTHVKVETSKNGVKETKEYSQNVGENEPVHINVSAKATNTDSEVEVRGWDAEKRAAVELEPATTSAGAEAEASARVVIRERFESALKSVPVFFKKVFGFLWGW